MAHLDWYGKGFGWYLEKKKELVVIPFSMQYYRDYILRDPKSGEADHLVSVPVSECRFTLPKELFK